MDSSKSKRHRLHGLLRRFKGKEAEGVPQPSKRENKETPPDESKEIEDSHDVKEESQSADLNSKTTSFWDQAAMTLDPKSRQALQEIRAEMDTLHPTDASKGDSHIDSLSDLVLNETQRRLQDMENRQWALPRRISDKATDLRSLMSKFIDFAKVVKEKGDALISLDPTGYAKLAWLPLSLVVDLTTIDLEQHQAALDAFTSISFLIYRYGQMEIVYQSRKTQDTQLEKCLVELYASVLECELALINHFQRNGLVRFLRAIPVLDGWVDRMSNITTLDGRCQALVEIQDSRELLNVRQDVEELVENKRRKENEEILEWITPHDPLVHRNIVLEKLAEDSSNVGNWLLEDETYVPWRNQQHSEEGVQLLWLHGPVGCGKTVLTTQVIESCLEDVAGSKQVRQQVSYFYCTKAHGSGSEPIDIFRSIVRQLAWSFDRSGIEDFIHETWKGRQSRQANKLLMSECKKLLLKLAERCQSTTIIIDALDECNNPSELLEALNEMKRGIQDRKVVLNIFISSRDNVHSAINMTFSEFLSINITSNTVASDLHHLIERRIRKEWDRYHLADREEYDGLFQQLVNTLNERGSLAFRWTELQLSLLFPAGRPFNPEAIEERLDRLRERVGLDDLNNTYREIYNSNVGDVSAYRRDLHFILKWALACDCPLGMHLLIQALKSHHEEHGKPTSHLNMHYVLNVASNLLVVGDDRAVHLAHISVKEYLQTSSEFNGEFSDMEANVQVANSCLRYVLSCGTFPKYSANRVMYEAEEDEFITYSFTRWPLHCARVGQSGRSGAVQILFKRLIFGPDAGKEFESWVLGCADWYSFNFDYIKDAISDPPSPFFVSCIWGYAEVVEEILRQSPGVLQSRNEDGKAGLHVAAYHGQLEICRVLINHGADINSTTENEKARSALHLATIRKHTDLVKMLLREQQGLDVNAKDGDGWTALHLAVKRRHLAIVEALLEDRRDLDINATAYLDEDRDLLLYDTWFPGRTALHLAVGNGDVETVQVLLEKRKDMNVNLLCASGTALHIAASNGHGDIVSLLLERREDIDINIQDEYRHTAFCLAAANGHINVLRALLEIETLETNTEDCNGLTALHMAASAGHFEVVDELVNHCDSICVNKQNVLGRTALHLAAARGHADVIRTLQNECEGLKINIVDSEGKTALHLPASRNHIEATEALLEHDDLDVNVRDADGCTALHLAAAGGHVEVVKVLLNDGNEINVNLLDNEARTALYVAVEKSYAQVVEILLDHKGINVNLEDNDGQTVLLIAASHSNPKIVEALLKKGKNININARDKSHQTALHRTLDFLPYSGKYYYRASRREWLLDSSIVVRVLLAHGIEINAKDKEGKTGFHLACKEGHDAAVDVFLKNKDLDPIVADVNGQTPLHLAASSASVNVVRQLIEKCSQTDINARDAEGRTVLHCAVSSGHLQTVQTLLDMCPSLDVNVQDRLGGSTALHLAVSANQKEIVQVLLQTRADIDITLEDHKGLTVLQLAVLERHASVVQTLLAIQRDWKLDHIDANGRNLLHIAAEKKSLEMSLTLVEACKGIAINAKETNGMTALHLFIQCGQRSYTKRHWTDGVAQVVSKLLQNFSDIDINAQDASGRTALHIAAQEGRFEVLETILKKGPDVNVNAKNNDGQTPLHIAASRGCMEPILALLARRGKSDKKIKEEWNRDESNVSDASDEEVEIQSNEDGESSSSSSSEDSISEDSSSEVSSSEVSGSEDSSSSDDDLTLPFVKMIDLLRACDGILLGERDKQGLSALHLAVVGYDSRVAESLLQHREVNINAGDAEGWTALHLAAFYGRYRFVKLLLTHREDVEINKCNEDGRTALHLAAAKGHAKTVNVLIDNGRSLDVSLRDGKGSTAQDLAAEAGHDKVVEILGGRAQVVADADVVSEPQLATSMST